MRFLGLYRGETLTSREVKVDDDIFARFADRKIRMNQWGYPMVFWDYKFKPFHCVVYYLKTGIWSKQYETAIHHKNENKFDARFENLELKDWGDHAREHGYEKPPFDKDNPNPNGLGL